LAEIVSLLGARPRVEQGGDVTAVATKVARELGANYMLLGVRTLRRPREPSEAPRPGEGSLARHGEHPQQAAA
jgi:hypothetical protein